MALNKYVGYGLTTALMWLMGKSSNSREESKMAPSALSVSASETKIGSTIPAIIGRAIVKSPMVNYFGDFSAKAYTETYAAHSGLKWRDLLWTALLGLIAALTGPVTNPGQRVDTSGGTGATTTPGHGSPYLKATIQGIIWAILVWLFDRLINGRNLRTTIQKGFKYKLGAQYLVCWSGPNLRVKRVYLGEQEVFSGDEGRRPDGSPFTLAVDDENLFGGVDENGGFAGELRFYLGGDAQQPDPWMQGQMSNANVPASLQGLTPAYRQFATVVMPTSYIGKRATLPALWVEMSNLPDALGLGPIGDDANPAEAIVEIITNTDWGLGESIDTLDLDALRQMGATLADEGLGVSLRLDATRKAADVLDAICEHIGAVRCADPATGKLAFRLIRDDYDPGDCRTLDERNVSELTMTRLDWSQVVSAVSGRFTDAANRYEAASVEASDGAAFAVSRGKAAKSYDFALFTTAANARWAALRELRSQAYPLAAVSATCNRALHGVRVGDVLALDFPPYGVKNMFLRVTDVDDGPYLDGQIKIEAVEDVFGLAKQEQVYGGGTAWQPERRFPGGVERFAYVELPYELAHDDESTRVAAFAAAPPDGDADQWTVHRQPPGGTFAPSSSLSKFTPCGLLVHALDELGPVEDVAGLDLRDASDVESVMPPDAPGPGCNEARKGNQYLVIGDEIIAWSDLARLPDGTWRVTGLLRGACDTVPQRHGPGEPAYFVSAGRWQLVTGRGGVCSTADTVDEAYNIVVSAGRDTEDFDQAKVTELTTARRAVRPSVMGRVRVSDLTHSDECAISVAGMDVSFSWAARNNRQTIAAVSQDDVDDWVSGSPIEAPPGTTYRVSIVDLADETLWTEDVAALNDTVPWETVCNAVANLRSPVTFKLETVDKDGLTSYQAQRRTMTYITPTLAGFATGKADAEAKAAAWLKGDRLDPPGLAPVPVSDLPMLFVASPGQGPLTDSAGVSQVPTGEAYIVNADGTLTRRDLGDGFAFRHNGVLYTRGGGLVAARTEA